MIVPLAITCMPWMGFLLQPTRSAPNLLASVACVFCCLFVFNRLWSYNSFNNLSSNLSSPQATNSQIAILVMTSKRPRATTGHLSQLKRLRPADVNSFPIIISQDGDDSSVTDAIRDFVASTPNSFFIHHKDRPMWNGSPRDLSNKQYFYIAQHYKWAIDQVFMKMNYFSILITEEDLDIADDFFSYFINTRHLLYEDPTIWCISAWNDNGSPKLIDLRQSEKLYRTDFFPGLGWMITSELWSELSEKWPLNYWDDWMRENSTRKDRVCIRPEVSRTLHNLSTAGKGTSNGLYKANWASMRLPDKPIDFSLVDTNNLKKQEYDQRFGQSLLNAKPLALSDFLDDSFRKETTNFSSLTSYRIVYNDPREYRQMAKKFGLMNDVRSGMMRTSYCGVVPFLVDGVRVFAIHKNLDLNRPFGSNPCSQIYEISWDKMGKYLDFADIFCTKTKWQGKCDPSDPDMIKWFENHHLLQRLDAWKGVIVF